MYNYAFFVKFFSWKKMLIVDIKTRHGRTVWYFRKFTLISLIFSKNFVKAAFLIKKLLKRWFDEIFFHWEFILPHCGGASYLFTGSCVIISKFSPIQIFSSNHIILQLFNRKLDLTEIFAKDLEKYDSCGERMLLSRNVLIKNLI